MSNARNSSNRRKLSDKNITKEYRYEDGKVHNGAIIKTIAFSLFRYIEPALLP